MSRWYRELAIYRERGDRESRDFTEELARFAREHAGAGMPTGCSPSGVESAAAEVGIWEVWAPTRDREPRDSRGWRRPPREGRERGQRPRKARSHPKVGGRKRQQEREGRQESPGPEERGRPCEHRSGRQ